MMKSRKLLILFTSIGLWYPFSNLYSSDIFDEDDFLTLTINAYADSLSNLLPMGSTVFIKDHSDFNGVTSYFGKYVALKISNHLTKNENFTVVDRNSIELIMKEQKFQNSGAVKETSAVDLGQMLGANIMVFGTITEFSKNVNIDSKILNVQTSKVIGTTDYSIKKTKDVANLIATVISSSEKQDKELEEKQKKILSEIEQERDNMIKKIDLERENKLAGLELEERQLKQKIANLESEYRKKSSVLKEYKVKKEKLIEIEEKIALIHNEINQSNSNFSLLKVGMRVDEVKSVIGERLSPLKTSLKGRDLRHAKNIGNKIPLNCASFGKYILIFDGNTLIKACMLGDYPSKDTYPTYRSWEPIYDCTDCKDSSLGSPNHLTY